MLAASLRPVQHRPTQRVAMLMFSRRDVLTSRAARRLLLTALALVFVVPSAPSAAPPAPIGIHVGEAREKGEWAFSYRFERVHRDGNRDGTSRQSNADVRVVFSDVPMEMNSDVHTFGIEHAPLSRLTLLAELPFVRRELQSSPAIGSKYTIHTDGIGDLKIYALVPFMRKGNERLHFYLGLGTPTSNVDDREKIQGVNTLVPYDMQIDEGTWNLMPGFAYRGHRGGLGWGLQASGTFRLSENEKDYRLGDSYEVTGWLAHDLVWGMSSSVRLAWNHWGDIRGRAKLGPDDNPASSRNTKSGARLDLGPGVSFALPFLGEQRISAEVVWPVYQSLEGPQLERDWTVMTGWHWTF